LGAFHFHIVAKRVAIVFSQFLGFSTLSKFLEIFAGTKWAQNLWPSSGFVLAKGSGGEDSPAAFALIVWMRSAAHHL
jgi:hypothetical protein